jgi:hypothetical protein
VTPAFALRVQSTQLYLQEQGYVVIGCDVPLKRGEILDISWIPYLGTSQPFYVLSEATPEEVDKQVALGEAYWGQRYPDFRKYHYKITTD